MWSRYFETSFSNFEITDCDTWFHWYASCSLHVICILHNHNFLDQSDINDIKQVSPRGIPVLHALITGCYLERPCQASRYVCVFCILSLDLLHSLNHANKHKHACTHLLKEIRALHAILINVFILRTRSLPLPPAPPAMRLSLWPILSPRSVCVSACYFIVVRIFCVRVPLCVLLPGCTCNVHIMCVFGTNLRMFAHWCCSWKSQKFWGFVGPTE